jgi:DNA-binding MarR family transcriptional regulator
MRPVVYGQNSLRYPLNELLGTEAQVRILRVLANDVDGPINAPHVAERTGLTIPGTHQALKRLLQSGFVVRVGGGRRHLYELNRSGRLIKDLVKLFQAEKNRYEALLNSIKKEFEKPVPYPRSAWIQELPNVYGDPLVIGVLHETKHLANYIHRLRTQLNRVERSFDITIELKGYTKADVPDLNADKVALLFGIMPFPDKHNLKMHTKPSTHKEKDQHMLELSYKLAEAIENDTSLVRRAKEHVQRMLKKNHGSATKDIKEWRDILESYSIRRLSRFLTSTSERANRLRQSSPFFAILCTDERKHLLNQLGEDG